MHTWPPLLQVLASKQMQYIEHAHAYKDVGVILGKSNPVGKWNWMPGGCVMNVDANNPTAPTQVRTDPLLALC